MVDERPASPFLGEPKDRDSAVPLMILSEDKIQRNRCPRSYCAFVSHVISPSEIWIKSLNNIADTLTVSRNELPEKETDLKIGKYVLAPIDNDTFVRARIIPNKINSKICLRLIDHGSIIYRDEDVLFRCRTKDEDRIRHYPWQARHVILDGVNPQNGKHWRKHETERLKQTLFQFEYFYVKPLVSLVYPINDDNDLAKVALFGMKGPPQQSVYDDTGRCVPPETRGTNIKELYYINDFTSEPLYEVDFIQSWYPAFVDAENEVYRATYQSFDFDN